MMLPFRRHVIGAGAVIALMAAGGMGARADIIKNGFLYVSDYGLSQLDRFQYTYDQTTNTITAFTPYGIGNNTTNASILGGPSIR